MLNLDFGSDDSVLDWAGTIADKYPDRHIILLTHDYLDTDNTWRGSVNPSDPTLPHNHNPTLNNGLQVWQKFVRTHQNVQFTYSGHVINTMSPSQPWATGSLVSTNQAGRSVYQTLVNFQTFSPGGQGYLRLVRVYPGDNRVESLTYSPYTGSYLTDPGNQYTFSDVDLGTWTQ